jgi:hypothetical protein
VPTALIFTGMACGALLAAAGLALWGGFRQIPGLPHAVRAIRWLTGVLLAIGALLAQGDHGLSMPTPRLILMAALAAPPSPRRRHFRGGVLLILPALILTGAGLLWRSGSTSVGIETSSLSVAITELAIAVCGGLGARALSQGLGKIVAPTPSLEGANLPSAVTHALLTLLVGGTALVNLWQRGSVWGETVHGRELVGAWLCWSAVWLSPRQPLWLRTALTAIATLLLVVLAARW